MIWNMSLRLADVCQVNFTVDSCLSAIGTSEQDAVRYSHWVRYTSEEWD